MSPYRTFNKMVIPLKLLILKKILQNKRLDESFIGRNVKDLSEDAIIYLHLVIL